MEETSWLPESQRFDLCNIYQQAIFLQGNEIVKLFMCGGDMASALEDVNIYMPCS